MINEINKWVDQQNEEKEQNGVNIENGDNNTDNSGRLWAFIHPDTFYTPFHWLSYQNDALSIRFMLNTLLKYKVEHMPHMIQTKEYGLTALDIAGRINA